MSIRTSGWRACARRCPRWTSCAPTVPAGSTADDAPRPGCGAGSDGAPGSTAPAPKLANYGAPQALKDAHNAGEPSIGVNAKTNSSFYQAYLSTYKVRSDDAVTPATATWTDVSAGAIKGCRQGSTQSLDPILYTDPTTGRAFESQLSGVDSLTCYTDHEGASWHPSQGGGIPSGVDHQTLGGGPFVASDPLNAGNLYPRGLLLQP